MAGTKRKSETRERRRREKRSRKQANQENFRAMAVRGANVKSKRYLSKSHRRLVSAIDHRLGPCGNIGCMKCGGRAAGPRIGHRAWLLDQRMKEQRL